jgi:hypothetical protein
MSSVEPSNQDGSYVLKLKGIDHPSFNYRFVDRFSNCRQVFRWTLSRLYDFRANEAGQVSYPARLRLQCHREFEHFPGAWILRRIFMPQTGATPFIFNCQNIQNQKGGTKVKRQTGRPFSIRNLVLPAIKYEIHCAR